MERSRIFRNEDHYHRLYYKEGKTLNYIISGKYPEVVLNRILQTRDIKVVFGAPAEL